MATQVDSLLREEDAFLVGKVTFRTLFPGRDVLCVQFCGVSFMHSLQYLIHLVQRRLKELKANISQMSKNNFVLERDVRFLEQRIALLINHKISIEASKLCGLRCGCLTSRILTTVFNNRRAFAWSFWCIFFV
jgi:hypothetical protein